MKDSNDPKQLNSKLDQLDIHSAVLRRGSLPHRSRPQSVKQSLPNESPPQAKPLYEQTYYISNLRDNYLTLISDNMQILQLPLGLISENVKIGCPIKLKLEYDYKRQQADQYRFKTIQKQLYEEFREKQEKSQ